MKRTAGEHRLVIEHLTKKYGDHAVVDDLTFTVEPGRITGFLGPNGSGKSTTMKIMLEPNAFHLGRSGSATAPKPSSLPTRAALSPRATAT